MQRLAGALSAVAGFPVELERPSDPAHGDYATNAALRLAGRLKRPPREVADELAGRIAGLAEVARVEVAGPGFLNLFLDDAWFGSALGLALAVGGDFGARSAAAPERVQVEMVSANPTGPITVASARNGAYGDSVARLLSFAGHDVEREYYYNDAGAQMERFRESVDAARRGEEPPEDGYRGAYVADLAGESGDPVPRMLERIEATLERFRIHFDSYERQSVVEAEIPEAVALLDTYESEGALWARTSAYGDEKDRVVIRSDGTPTYFAADAAYVRRKYAKGFDRLVYVLGADHHGYVARLQALAQMLGRPRESLEVLIYQLVHLTKGGEATKMSKRRGDVVFLDDFIDEIGIDAARWYLVSRGHDQTIEIDVDLAAEKTAKNPVYYVQYAHARIAGILRNAGDAVPAATVSAPLAPEERDLVKRIAEFPAVAAEAAQRRAPHAIATYAIRVADDFHRFYHHHKVLGSEAEAFRLGLCSATRTVVARCLDLVGVEAPERM
ncbi:Arginyl-tRNA synthetase [Gaiella occulta]|uniref:Arginine--tRNA ligase n=1 Tax=Gaiella occulta TaxID=1002870 RepID=A0A7M2YZD9_9ACTN|nr:arginine--tRNA ligase [Gaiella occulta]RDI75238.1 Arginyl-tRNA synthetase [Gaiella occulta]